MLLASERRTPMPSLELLLIRLPRSLRPSLLNTLTPFHVFLLLLLLLLPFPWSLLMQIEWHAMGACHSASAARLARHDAGAEAVGRYEGPRDSDVRPLAAAPLAARGTLAR